MDKRLLAPCGMHCGLCREFPCDLFVDHFDPDDPLGQKSAIMRAGLLAYRKRAGTEKYVEMVKKLKATNK